MSREKNEKEASEVLSDFLKFVRRCEDDYQAAREAVGVEDKRRQKDEVQRLEPIMNFFDELNHKNTLKKMEQLLGRQRKVEEYLNGERVYYPRVKD